MTRGKGPGELYAAETRRQVLAHPMLILAEADAVLGLAGAAAAAITAGRLVAVDDDGDMLIPAFQLDGPAGVARPVVAKLNVSLGARAHSPVRGHPVQPGPRRDRDGRQGSEGTDSAD